MPDFDQYVAEDARLTILRELASQRDGRLNSTILTKVLFAFGHNPSREWLFAQLEHLRKHGAVTLGEAGSIVIATITETGIDHVERRHWIEGVARPRTGV